jgi:hypothetical protein
MNYDSRIMTDYLVIYQGGSKSFSAHIPALPGCIIESVNKIDIESDAVKAIKSHLASIGELKQFTVTLSLAKIPTRKMSMLVAKHKLGEEPNDADYWADKSPNERIIALEILRNQHIDQNGLSTRLQRVYRVIK